MCTLSERNTQSVCVCVFVCVLMGQDAVIVYRERYTLLRHVDPRQPERDREGERERAIERERARERERERARERDRERDRESESNR